MEWTLPAHPPGQYNSADLSIDGANEHPFHPIQPPTSLSRSVTLSSAVADGSALSPSIRHAARQHVRPRPPQKEVSETCRKDRGGEGLVLLLLFRNGARSIQKVKTGAEFNDGHLFSFAHALNSAGSFEDGGNRSTTATVLFP